MADDPHNTSNVSDEQVEVEPKEDAETAAAREELKQTVISERTAKTTDEATDEMVATRSGGRYGADAPSKPAEARTKTPERDLADNQNDLLKDQVSSPKKKRAHDQLDEPKDGAQDKAAGEEAAASADRSEPEKKRPRDGLRGDDDLSKSSQDGSVGHDASEFLIPSANGRISGALAQRAEGQYPGRREEQRGGQEREHTACHIFSCI